MAQRLAEMRLGDDLEEDTKKSAAQMLDAQRQQLAMQHGAKLAELKLQRERLQKVSAELSQAGLGKCA